MSPNRIHALDALRGIAALWVVVYHDVLRYPYFMAGAEMPWTPLLPDVVPGLAIAEAGIVPVLWFFLISGFVITWTIDRCRTPMDFVVSRASRLYPAFWAAMTVSVVLGLLWPLPGTALTGTQILGNMTMLQDYLGIPAIDGVYWSLTVELRFYLYALILFALGQWRRVHLVAFAWALVALISALLAARDIWVPYRLKQMLMTEYGPFLVAGMMIYRLWRRQHVKWSALTLVTAIAAILAGTNVLPAATVLIVMASIAWSAHGGLQWLAAPPLLWLGNISYALYLSHETLSFTIIRSLDSAGWPHNAAILFAIAAALILAHAITVGIERPAMRFIRTAWRRQPGNPAIQ